MTFPRSRAQGFTIIELFVVIVILCILGTLVILTSSGVRAKNRNSDRQLAINNLQATMEAYYAQFSKYPTLANINDASWRATNAKDLEAADLQDPRWSSEIMGCTADKKAVLADTPTDNCYAYQVTASDGSACDNVAVDCAHYTLTAMLEGSDKYVKSSLN